MDLDNINASIESDFEFAEDTPTLGQHIPADPDRSTILQNEAGKASYRAEINRVQYGTYKGERACLMVFTFLFDFTGKSRVRFHSADISIRFRRGSKPESSVLLPSTSDKYEGDRPHILQLSPYLAYGTVSTVTTQRSVSVEAQFGIQAPFAAAQVVPGIQKSDTAPRDFRISIKGGRRYTSSIDSDDEAFWSINENAIQKDGIFPSVQTAVVLRLPRDGATVLAYIRVVPQFKYHVRGSLQLLRQRRNDPIRFDGKTPRGEQENAGVDFADSSFNLSKVVEEPTEYENKMLLVS